MNIIQNGQTERILASALDINNDFIDSLTDMLIEIERKSDGYYYDFDDDTFKTSGWTTRQNQMVELDTVNSLGTYYYDFDTTGLSDDEYYIRVSSVTAINSPWEDDLKVGGYIDNIDATISSRSSSVELTALQTLVERILGLSQENYRIKSPIYNGNNSLTSATINIYGSANDCTNDNNPTASYSMIATYDENLNMSSYKVIKS